MTPFQPLRETCRATAVFFLSSTEYDSRYAAKSQKGDRWNKFRLNSLTAPNIVQRKTVITGQVDYDWVLDKLENWCTKIQPDEVRSEMDDFQFEGQWYRPEDLFRKKSSRAVPES